MSQKRHSARLFVAALAALVMGGLASAQGLVFCLGVGGHRAIEFDHSGMECPTLASSQPAIGISVQTPSECLDLPAIGTGPMTLLSFDAEQVPMPPVVFLAVSLESTPRLDSRLAYTTYARAGPLNSTLHLRSTILLV